MFDNGVKTYVKARADIYVWFPDGKVAFQYCRFYHPSQRYCGLDKNIVPAYPQSFVGVGCPLYIAEEATDETT